MNVELVTALQKRGYVRLARFDGAESQEVEQYLEMVRMSPNYTDHALMIDEATGQAMIYARKIRSEVSRSLYRSAIIERVDKQSDKGLVKYKQLLQDNRLNAIARLEYLAEELTDGLQYIEHAKVGLHEVFDELSLLIGRIMMVSARCESDERMELADIAKEANKLLGKVMGFDEDNEQGREEDNR